MRFLFVVTVLAICVVQITGCDPVIYKIRGHVVRQGQTPIQNTKIDLKCANIRDKQTFSDINGYFILEGWGIVEGCELCFEHPDYQKTSILIEGKLRKEGEPYLRPIYENNVELLPISQNE